MFGNPHPPPAIDSSWRTESVVALAHGIYEERAWARMGVLADALEDSGGDIAELLDHCRGVEPHHRGCWVVDLVLGMG
ncbi:hypothetical protein J0H58_21085 [bacterium]|nr:hypothetical protein [bacterium]